MSTLNLTGYTSKSADVAAYKDIIDQVVAAGSGINLDGYGFIGSLTDAVRDIVVDVIAHPSTLNLNGYGLKSADVAAIRDIILDILAQGGGGGSGNLLDFSDPNNSMYLALFSLGVN